MFGTSKKLKAAQEALASAEYDIASLSEMLQRRHSRYKQSIALHLDAIEALKARNEELLQQNFEQAAELATFRTARARSNQNLRNSNAERARLAALRDEAASLVSQVSE